MRALIYFFVQRPVLVNLLMVFAFFTGALALNNMKYEVMPKIEMGIVKISTFHPGAGPEEIELGITLPLEEEILKIDGIKKLNSNSMDGISVISVRLDPEQEDLQKTINELQKAVDRASTRLPVDLQDKPLLEELSSLKFPIMEVHIVGAVPESLLRQTARQLSDGLREIKGVAGIEKIGYRPREVHIQLNQLQMQHLGISYAEIIHAIQRRNVRDSGGSLESFVAEKKVLTIGQFATPKEIEEVIIRSGQAGNTVRIRDIAEVVLDYQDWQIQSRTDGNLSIALTALKKEHSDGLQTTQALRDFITKARANLPPGVELILVNDISRFTYDMIDALGSNALLGIVLVFLVLWLFLHWRLSLWVTLGMPTTVMICFALMPTMGLAIDSLSLMALILVLGMLVDDAVVTSESIQSRREQGDDLQAASTKGTTAITAPVLVSSLSTILAFAPVAFLGGLEGEFLWTLPVMIALVLGASLFECYFMLPAHLAHGYPVKKLAEKPWFTKFHQKYHQFILRALQKRYKTITLFILSFALIVTYGVSVMQFNLYPDVDIDTVNVKIELPQGTSFAKTIKKSAEVEAMIRQQLPEQELLNIVTRIGHHDTDIYGVTEGRNPAWALISIYMLPQGQRTIDSNLLMADLRKEAAQLKGFARIIFEPLKDTPVAGKPVELEIIGNTEGRYEVAEKISQFLQQQTAVTDVWTSYKTGKDIVQLKLDYTLMAARNISVLDVTQAVRIAFDGQIIDELQTLDERIKYRLKYTGESQNKLATLENLIIMTPTGDSIYLKTIAELEVRPGEANIKHYFGQRSMTLYAEIDRDLISVQEINDAIADYVSESGLLQKHPKLRLWYGGELEQQQDSMGDMQIAFVFCLMSVFFILVVLFNSLTQPLLILIAIPFSLTGVIIGFAIQGLPLSIIALIGILGLIGVLVNDSLVMIHNLNKLNSGNISVVTIAQGAAQRLRPIVITSLTTAAGLFPTAYGIAGSNPFLTPMVMAMAWGVVFGTLVSLILIPCLYAIDQDIKAYFHRTAKKYYKT
ncbi:MAG: efflux RND transporter permease subunit [Methyloprofundus sp.]|nr:efflux RND transporter permease subunit [Methyloprofundus sp.]